MKCPEHDFLIGRFDEVDQWHGPQAVKTYHHRIFAVEIYIKSCLCTETLRLHHLGEKINTTAPAVTLETLQPTWKATEKGQDCS